MPETFLTIQTEFRHEPDKIKGSRHIATVIPIQCEAEVSGHLERVAQELTRANHHAYAWRLGRDREKFRYNDNGEPSGSAGKPMLQQIDGHELTNVLVVVTRYFGGTKLGVGGLVRAYGGACAEALDLADIVEVTITRRVTIVYDYDLSNAVQSVIASSGFEPLASEYADKVTMQFDVPESKTEAFVAELRERTANRMAIEAAPASM